MIGLMASILLKNDLLQTVLACGLFICTPYILYSELVLLVGLYRKRTSNEEIDQVTKGTTTWENEEKKKKKQAKTKTKQNKNQNPTEKYERCEKIDKSLAWERKVAWSQNN